MMPAGKTLARETWPQGLSGLDVARIREDFPILRQKVHGKPLVYLDSAATSQKPQVVLDAMQHFLTTSNANVHRGVHELSERATEAFEEARRQAQHFLNAGDWREIIFVRGATEAINLVAQSFGRERLRAGDEILISTMEHHSNIVPWQIVAQQTGAVLRVAPINDRGELLMDELRALVTPRTRLLAVTHVSNALGTVNPVGDIVTLAHRQGIPVLIDGAQAVPHMKVDVRELDCDFYAFSGHKVYGPTGIGVLYGKRGLLESMPPYQGGGDMIKSVTFAQTVYNDLPYKFEAGTPNLVGTVGLGAAIGYVRAVGLGNISAYEQELLAYATEALTAIRGLRLLGTAREKAAVLSFVIEGIHPHDIGTILDHEGVAVRTGHHCAQPVMERFGVPASTRASLAFYNTREEVDTLVQAIHKAMRIFH